MSKVTSKFQVSLPRALARAHRIRPGTELAFESSGEDLRVRVSRAGKDVVLSRREALAAFDEATQRQRERNAALLARLGKANRTPPDRGWAREDLYADRTTARRP
jgi:bifunctional DNA-binding transcriptional regulator/antitoxin component of YhaV-PrlF toxin-antitoxin module